MKLKNVLSRTLTIAALVALGIGTLAGCSQSPTSPASTRASAGALGATPEKWADPTPVETAPPSLLPVDLKADAESSRWIEPLLGGTVVAGQFRVVIPPGALRERGFVTVRQPKLSAHVVQLEISPPSANGFVVPVMLVADCSDMSLKLLSVQTIYWWNPQAQRWEAMLNVQINLLGRTVSCPLWHFSSYKVDGKAGW